MNDMSVDIIPSVQELINRAQEMQPSLREKARETEEKRRVLDSTVASFQEAGFYRILQPKQYGGYEYAPEVLYRVVMEVAQACPASAWCLSVVGIHNYEMGLFGQQVCDEVWLNDPHARISSSYAPFGKMEHVEGGVRISGRWPYSSGSSECNWVILGGLCQYPGEEQPRLLSALIPSSDYVIEDTWHVSGLAGTGSNDIVVEGAFVPEHRLHNMGLEHARMDTTSIELDGRTYQYPFFATFGYCLASSVLGMAKGALALFIEQNQTRMDAMNGGEYKSNPFIHDRLAKAWALIDAAELKWSRDMRQMEEYIGTGKLPTSDERIKYRWNLVWIANTAAEAVEILYKASGARANYLNNPMQRFFRDSQVAANHAFLNRDKSSSNFGNYVLCGVYKDFSY